MEACGRCQEKLPSTGDYVSCGTCDRHYHFENCSGLSERTWRQKSTDAKTKWRCPVFCRNTTSNTLNSPTIPPSQQQPPFEQSKEESMRDVMAILAEIQLQLTELNTTITRLATKQEEMAKELELEREENKKKEGRIIKIEEQIKKINNMEERINGLEQYGRNRQWEIHNMPEVPGEQLAEIVVKLGTKIKVEIKKTDIEVIHRIPSSNGNKPKTIIIEMNSRKKRNEIIEAKKKIVTQNDILGSGTSGRIYINESLTPYNKDLFWKARETGKKNNYKYTWFKNNKIMMRKDEQSRPIIIKKEEDLFKVE